MERDRTSDIGESEDPHGDSLIEPVEPFTDPQGFGSSGRTQDAPRMEQNRVTTRERIDGILEQTGADVGDHPLEDIAEALRVRFADARIDIDGDELERMARAISRTSEGVPEGTFEAYREQEESD